MTPSEIFAQANLDIFNALGVLVTYTPTSGIPVENIKALISTSLQEQPSGMGSETWGQHVTVELLLSDIPGGEPSRGDTVDDGINVYVLAAPLENDGQIIKWTVT